MTKKRRSMPQNNGAVSNQSIKQTIIDDNFELPPIKSSRTVMSLVTLIGIVCLCALISQTLSQPFNLSLTNQTANIKPVVQGPVSPLKFSINPSNNRMIRDPLCFTQGIEFHGDYLYESCGMYSASRLIKRNAVTGATVKQIALDGKLFAEGLTVINDLLYLLTWREKVALVYDLELNLVEKYNFNHDGWGITHHNNELIVTDGSDALRFYDTQFHLLRTTKVRAYDSTSKSFRAVANLNELEMIDGLLWANQWMAHDIHVIDLASGHVTATIDCTKLVNVAGGDTYEKVLNGIALNHTDQTVLLTGKYWAMGFITEKPNITS